MFGTRTFHCWMILIILFQSCNSTSSNKKHTKEVVKKPKTESRDFSEIDYKLPGSDYIYKIKIIDIKTKIAKAAFTSKEDNYSVPKDVDGYYLTIKYSITNPYEKEMMVPIPDYYYISSLNKEWFSSSTTFHRDCQCQIDNSTTVTNEKGEELWEFFDSKCGYNDKCIKFKPHETKNIKVKFDDPIFVEVRKLVFWGFDLKWKDPNYTRDKDKALVIDIDQKKVIDEINL